MARRRGRAYPITGFVIGHAVVENPEISGAEYQRGGLFVFELREYVLIKSKHRYFYAGADSPCDQVLNLDQSPAVARRIESSKQSRLRLS
ncbi:MAG: hypothetical protein J2P21_17325 [Chloracidobacterium sp.]|nr:hypothetical protein [Chloracidobacterium sp.]